MLLRTVDESVFNAVNYECFSDCDSTTASGIIDMDTTDMNSCCTTTSKTTGYGKDTMSCTPCEFYSVCTHMCM